MPIARFIQHRLADVEADDKAGFPYELGQLTGILARPASDVGRSAAGAKLHQSEGFSLVGTKELKRVHSVQTADQFGGIGLVHVRKSAQKSRPGVCC
jgi:hypothetical protein